MKSTRKRLRRREGKNKTCKNFIPPSDKDIEAIIDVNAIRNNIQYLRKKSGADLMPVLKADAYGHGLIDMARILRRLGITYIGVATLGEAILLRKSGDKGRVLSWLYDIDGDEFRDGVRLNLDIAIFDETLLPKIKRLIPSGKRLKVTVFVDTGINRAGVPYDKALQLFQDIVACKEKFELVGMMSHLVCSTIKNSPIVNEQLRKFRVLRQQLADLGIKPPLVHIANTGACLNYDVSDFTLSRPGSGIYGIPGNSPNKYLKLAMTVKSYVIQLKEVNKGDGIGYDWKFKAPRHMRIAVLPIGYADIIPRSSSGKLHIFINGTKRKVLGTVSMDQIIVEAKKEDQINDDAVIFGNGTDCKQTVFDVAKARKCISFGNFVSHWLSGETKLFFHKGGGWRRSLSSFLKHIWPRPFCLFSRNVELESLFETWIL